MEMKRRGLDKVKMIWHGENNDPELEYNGIVANYWTIEDTLYERFKEDMDDRILAISDKEFSQWLKDNFYIVEEVFDNYKNFNS